MSSILFSPEAAKAACAALETCANNIAANGATLSSVQQKMRKAWSGTLANAVIEQLESCSKIVSETEAHVNNLNTHIALCRRNYGLTEDSNVKKIKSIDSMYS